MKVLIIGSGGREHATVETFLRSDGVKRLYVAPGNDGVFNSSRGINPRLEQIDLRVENPRDIRQLIRIVQELKIDFAFVGPEKPLSLGIVDVFEKKNCYYWSQ